MATPKFERIKEVELCKMLEVSIPKLQWLSRIGLGPVKQVKSSELVI